MVESTKKNQVMSLLQERLASYQLKGRVLKQVAKDIENWIDGLVCGVAGAVLEDDSCVIYNMDRKKKPMIATPRLSWMDRKVKELQGEAVEISYVLPKDRSVGVLVYQDAEKILIPLRFT